VSKDLLFFEKAGILMMRREEREREREGERKAMVRGSLLWFEMMRRV
jgi:hypothetical protein